MKQLIDDRQVFAIVSGLTAGAERVATLSRDREVPFIGPSTLLPDRATPLNRYIFYLLPGLKEQARSLVNFAAKKSDLQKAQVAKSFRLILSSAKRLRRVLKNRKRNSGGGSKTECLLPTR